MIVLSSGITTFADAEAEFERAWADPSHTPFELPAVNVNKVLSERYTVSPPTKFTRTALWDMETKKAWDPKSYIPYVVSSGHSWGRRELSVNCERFYRSSIQLGWITEERGLVLEDVFIDRTQRKSWLMGRGKMSSDNGEHLPASSSQPLFHVEHTGA